ncbi:MAG: transposase [Methanococcoides sp.]|nr:transposase [Methanococcoides sp.]
MGVNLDHLPLFIKCPLKYSVSYISKMIKGRSSRVHRKEFPHLKECCGDHLCGNWLGCSREIYLGI